MFDLFSHYVSYGATDQETIRELTGAIDGRWCVLVPATVAAFQQQGTGGFILTLSATAEAPNYVIDPRFPLFQHRSAPRRPLMSRWRNCSVLLSWSGLSTLSRLIFHLHSSSRSQSIGWTLTTAIERTCRRSVRSMPGASTNRSSRYPRGHRSTYSLPTSLRRDRGTLGGGYRTHSMRPQPVMPTPWCEW
jgi:hypothetical protein